MPGQRLASLGRALARPFRSRHSRTETRFDAQLERLAATLPPVPSDLPEARHERILMATFAGGSTLFLGREGLLAHALALRGAQVSVVLCDEFLPACEMRMAADRRVEQCLDCHRAGARGYERFGIDTLPIGRYLGRARRRELAAVADRCPVEELFTFQHREIPVGALAYSSLVRHCLSGGIDLEDAAQRSRAREFLLAALVMTEACEALLKDLEPHKVFISHGVYVTWGPLFHVAQRMGIPVDTFETSFRSDTLRAYHETTVTPWPEGEWPTVRDLPLTADQERAVDEYWHTREDGSADFHSVNPNPKALEGETLDWLRDGEQGLVFGLFTNIAWDAVLFQSGDSYASMFEWVNLTVERFRAHPEHRLVIKAHPAEVRGVVPTAERWRLEHHLRAAHPELPDNIHFLPPESEVSTFELYEHVDWGLVHISTVGLELAMRGTPVLTSEGGSHYARKGFTLDPRDKGEYLEFLEEILSGRRSFAPDLDQARRYVYYRFFREGLPFDVLDVNGWKLEGIRAQSLEELLPGRHRGVDLLCDGVLNDAPYLS